LPLIHIQSPRPPARSSLTPSLGNPGSHPFAQELTFHLSHCGEQSQHEAAGRSRRVEAESEDPQAHIPLLEVCTS
jgi:hypothetical protein